MRRRLESLDSAPVRVTVVAAGSHSNEDSSMSDPNLDEFAASLVPRTGPFPAWMSWVPIGNKPGRSRAMPATASESRAGLMAPCRTLDLLCPTNSGLLRLA